MPRRARSRLVLGAVVTVLVAACTGADDPGGDPSPGDAGGGGVEAPAAPENVSAQVSEGVAEVTWTPVEGVATYRVGDGTVETDVPAAVCSGDECVVGVDTAAAGETVEFSVRSVAGEAVSDAVSSAVDVPEAEPTDDPAPAELEVLLVRAGTPPQLEVVPVDSEAEAQAVIDDAQRPDSGVLSATLNAVAEPATQNEPDDNGRGPGGWQAEAMRFNLLPGDPPGDGVTVAVIEKGGVEAGHPTFGGAVAQGTHVDDDSLTGVSEPEDHATFVASMIAGQLDTGVRGIAPGATILPVDVGDGREGDLIEGIIWAADNGADVINVSLAMDCDVPGPFDFCPDGLRSATDYAESQGVVVVAGAGNNGAGADYCFEPTDIDIWPAVLETVISVGGHVASGERWVCTPDRPDVDVLAPSAGLLGATAGGGYKIGQGTSYASPLIAGLVAVILAERPELTPAEIRAMISQSLYADGRINVAGLLLAAGLDPTDDPDIDVEDAEGIYPYLVDLGFEGDHPVSVALGEKYPGGLGSGWHSDVSYGGGFWERDQNGVAPFGEIAGLIVVDSEGNASASGVWTFAHGHGYGDAAMPMWGHWVECPSYRGWDPIPARVFRWDVPVVVDVAVSGDPEEPDFDLTFSLGVGATAARPGELPGMTVPSDTLDKCASYLEADDGYRIDTGYAWAEVEPVFEEYTATMEAVYQALVDNSPYSTAEPVSSRFTSKRTEDDDDPQVHIGYTNGFPDRVRPNL